MTKIILSFFLILFYLYVDGQTKDIQYIPAKIDFSEKIQEWDGFGFNYVEASQTRNYHERPQDYGGFSLLKEKQKQEILDLVFGKGGLEVEIVKMFLDPWHQKMPGAPFDHETTTVNMREFVKRGVEMSEARGDELEIITTLYGPPAWATQQKFIGGRDLDPAQSENLGRYMADWLKYLKENDYPVKYLSLHNEGEDFYRWDFEDGTQRLQGFDYNMYWSPEQVNDFLKLMPQILNNYDLNEIKVTNGEPSNWTRFYNWGYTNAIFTDEEALSNLGLLTTHGFINGDFRKLSHSYIDGRTTTLLRSNRPDLNTWITSYSWGSSGTEFVKTVYEHIYTAEVNALIPWAGIQNPSKWIDGDPNPGTAVIVNDDGTYKITNWYYFYKQLTTAGRRGMSTVKTMLANPVAFIIGFGSNGTNHPDAFVVTSNIFIWKLPLRIEMKGTKYTKFRAFRTSEDGEESFQEIGVFEVKNGSVIYDPPKGTTTTFVGVK
jgi:O-glycosyl hydrolase